MNDSLKDLARAFGVFEGAYEKYLIDLGLKESFDFCPSCGERYEFDDELETWRNSWGAVVPTYKNDDEDDDETVIARALGAAIVDDKNIVTQHLCSRCHDVPVGIDIVNEKGQFFYTVKG